MKKFILILTLLFITVQALALDSGLFEIRVTINRPPEITNFTPEDGSALTVGDELEITVVATDPNDNIQEYVFYIRNETSDVVDSWTSEVNLINHTLAEGNIGLNSIWAEVTDDCDETVQTGEVEIFVFRKSPDLPAGG